MALGMGDSPDLDCPFCGYDLRGQTDPRCPECGYTFAWDDLRDPQRRIHPTLYEHHPERGSRAFWQTLLQSLRPQQFWRRVRPEQTVHPKRLFRYIGRIYVLILVLVVLFSLYGGIRLVQQRNAHRALFLSSFTQLAALPEPSEFVETRLQRYGSPAAWVDADYPRLSILEATWESVAHILPAYALLSLWPLFTFGSLVILRWSMRRANRTKLHVLRSVAYTSDAAVWLVLVVVATEAGFIPYQLTTWLLLSVFVFSAYRLAAAYRSYMQMNHSAAVGIVSQAIVVLASMCIALLF